MSETALRLARERIAFRFRLSRPHSRPLWRLMLVFADHELATGHPAELAQVLESLRTIWLGVAVVERRRS